MKYCAVICELNPFHNGHEYIFRRAREVSGCDGLIALMSGSFVQRAVPASIDEYSRAECALRLGADIVIELPAVYAVASGEIFARGAVDILNTIPGMSHLVMGAENADKPLMERIAHIRASNDAAFSAALSSALGDGLTYARALTRALSEALHDVPSDRTEALLTCPNNILAISYAQALAATDSRIAFVPVQRAKDETRYSSATALRSDITERDEEAYMPPEARGIWRKEKTGDLSYGFGLLVMAALRERPLSEIAAVPDCAEGFEYKLKALARSCSGFGELMSVVPTSRFTRSRIMRICLQTLLGMTRDMQHCGYVNARLLGVREDAKDMLRDLPVNIVIGKRGEATVPSEHMRCFATERRASDIWSLIARRPCDFYRRLLVVR